MGGIRGPCSKPTTLASMWHRGHRKARVWDCCNNPVKHDSNPIKHDSILTGEMLEVERSIQSLDVFDGAVYRTIDIQ